MFLFSCNNNDNIKLKEKTNDISTQIHDKNLKEKDNNNKENDLWFNDDYFNKDLDNLFTEIFK